MATPVKLIVAQSLQTPTVFGMNKHGSLDDFGTLAPNYIGTEKRHLIVQFDVGSTGNIVFALTTEEFIDGFNTMIISTGTGITAQLTHPGVGFDTYVGTSLDFYNYIKARKDEVVELVLSFTTVVAAADAPKGNKPAPSKATNPQTPDLESMTKAELITYGEDLGLIIDTTAKKADILALIKG